MTLPTRPVAHASIESAWGQAIHDYTFGPAGCRVHSTSTVNVNVTPINTCHIDVADADPGGYMDAANDRLVVPTNGAGLYSYAFRVTSTNGTTGDTVRAILYLNGGFISSWIENCITSTQIVVSGAGHIVLTAGDILTIGVQRSGGATLPVASLTQLSIVRIGADYGAP